MRARAALRLVLALAPCLVSVLPEQGQANGPDDARVIELRVRCNDTERLEKLFEMYTKMTTKVPA